MSEICIRCLWEGSYLGVGMMRVDCNLCNNNDDYEPKIKAPLLDKINRNSKSYQKAIKDIMSVNQDISRKEAIQMFDEAYVKG